MPGPQFATPRPLPHSQSRKHFTLAQANRSLPLVRRIVRDIVQAHERAAALQMKLAEMSGGPESKATQDELEEAMLRLQEFVEELTEIGCELKDYQMGLIDFFGRHQGRDVCLCWRLGEEQIGYWHELHSGFTARQPISTFHETT